MFRLRLAVVVGSVATAVMLSFAAAAPEAGRGAASAAARQPERRSAAR